MADNQVFSRCRNCSRYVPAAEAYRKYYCCEECARQFLRCKNCGRYFPNAGAGTVSYCSSECAAFYPLRLEERIVELLQEES